MSMCIKYHSYDTLLVKVKKRFRGLMAILYNISAMDKYPNNEGMSLYDFNKPPI
jgi:hypothetical protein